MKRIVVTGGGTGGHVFPALAVLEHIAPEPEVTIVWIGSRRGMERAIVRGSGIEYRAIPVGKLRRYVSFENVTDLFRVVAGVVRARSVLRHERADVVFSKGGFVAVPVVIAARTLGIPVVVHESDGDPGLATRLTAPFAAHVCVAYPDTAEVIRRDRVAALVRRVPWVCRMVPRRTIHVTGNPVRRGFSPGPPDSESVAAVRRRDGELADRIAEPVPRVLVTGGSLGARELNELVSDHLEELCRLAIVIHQCGEHGRDSAAANARRAPAGRYLVRARFGDEYAAVLRAADVVLSRAGAGAIWEFAATGTPAILLPLSTSASRGDQIRNARRYAECGAAIVSEGGARSCVDALASLLHDRARRVRMMHAALSFSGDGAGGRIAGIVVAAMTDTDGKEDHDDVERT